MFYADFICRKKGNETSELTQAMNNRE